MEADLVRFSIVLMGHKSPFFTRELRIEPGQKLITAIC